MSKHRLSSRITWRVILIMAIFSVFIIGVVFLFDMIISGLESETRSQYVIDGIDGKLTTMLSGVEITATNNVAEFEENLDNPEKLCKAMEHELRFNNRYLGCGMGFEPDYFPSQGRWFEPYVRFVDSTHVERDQIGSAQHDYHSQEWYLKGRSLARGKGYLTDPYFDKDGGKRLLSTFVTPVFDRQDRLVGVYGIDLNLDWIAQTIADEEQRAMNLSLLRDNEDDPADDDDETLFFIQILDSKGKKIAGSDSLDAEVLKTVMKADSLVSEKVKMNDATYYITSKRITGTGWTVVVAQHKFFAMINGIVVAIVILFFMIIGCIIMFFLTSHGIRRAIKPLRFLSDSAQEVAHGNFDAPLPTFKHQDEITQLRDSFGTMQQSLKQYVEELKASTAAKASMESELNVAHSIQMSMLPKTFPERSDIELYGILKPAKAVGGDLYDFFIRDEKLFFCIGDVSGKGVPASLVMAVSRTLFRNIAVHTAEPGHIVETMNNAISDSNDSSMFVTLFVGVLDLQTGHLRYCNAGHNAPYLLQAPADSSLFTLHSSLLPVDPNLPVGAMPDWTFTEQTADITEGSTLFLYTDGLTEAEDAQHDLFGEKRVAEVIASFEGSPEELIETMTAAVRQFVGDTEQSDDLTMLAIQLHKES